MIYIQSNKERTLPHHFDASCALYGAIDSGFDFRLTSFEEVESGKFDQLISSNLFVGSVEFMREVFKRIGLSPKLPMNSDRINEICSMKDVRERVSNGEKLFVKPFEIKQFSGLVVDEYSISCLKDLNEDLDVMVYKPFESKILSEWRVYILERKLIDCRNYSGDFKICPNYRYIENRIQNFNETFPIAYTMDIGVLTNAGDVIIEFNDFWSIGNYGMENSLYLRALKQRYFEIIRKGK